MPGLIPAATATATAAARPRIVEKFAAGRTDAVPNIAERPTPAPAKVPVGTVVQVEHKAVAPPAPVETPRLMHPVFGHPTVRPGPEPTPDAEGIIRPHWPVIPGSPPLSDRPPADADENLVLPPPSELMKAVGTPAPLPGPIPMALPDEALVPAAPPPAPLPALPPGVIGSSVHQSHASPAGMTPAEQALSGEQIVPVAVNALPAGPVGDTPLLRAILAFQQSRPDEAVEMLKAYDPATQQILLSLMPALVRLSEGKLQSMRPEEMDVLLDQLARVPNMLRPRASLRVENVRLCREVHTFAHVEPFPERHTFRPGDIIYLYMELANFSCVPDPKGGFAVTLASSLEMKDAAGAVVWRADPKEAADHVSTPPQDYYRNFRLCIPSVPPGMYTLAVKTTDRPTERIAQKSVEVRVGAR
jgi:hypothetical protein